MDQVFEFTTEFSTSFMFEDGITIKLTYDAETELFTLLDEMVRFSTTVNQGDLVKELPCFHKIILELRNGLNASPSMQP